jgi:hypothetical protein
MEVEDGERFVFRRGLSRLSRPRLRLGILCRKKLEKVNLISQAVESNQIYQLS